MIHHNNFYKIIIMKDMYFYLLLGVFLYFILTKLLDNYLNNNLEQENFDPSLVPVSSIVTLAKVAQKLVNGNGTLTNPGNLQIGIGNGSATGNLRVTGSSTVGSSTDGLKTFNVVGTTDISGNTDIRGTLDVTGATTIKASTTINGATTINGDFITKGSTNRFNSSQGNDTWFPYTDGKNYIRGGLQIDNGAGNKTTLNGPLNVTGSTTIGSTTSQSNTFNVVGTAGISSDAAIGGRLNVTSNISSGGNISGGGVSFVSGLKSPDSSLVTFGDGSGWRLNFGHGSPPSFSSSVSIFDNGQIKIGGAGNFCIGSTCINETHLKMLTGQFAVQFGKTTCSPNDPSGECGQREGNTCINPAGWNDTPGCGTARASVFMSPFYHAHGY